MSEFARVILDKCNSAMGRLRVLLGFYFKANLSAKPLLRISVSFVLKEEVITETKLTHRDFLWKRV